MIRRSFINKGVDISLPLHKSLVRPRLYYCVQTWSQFLINDMEVEKVQKRATRMIDGFANKDYDRLKELGLTTLETKRKRSDLTEAFKMDAVIFTVQ